MTSAADQTPVLKCLMDPALHEGATPHLIETHANFVIVGPRHAYKVKRAIKYPFLDYSTLPLRKQYCIAEAALNARTAPMVYIGAAPILKRDGGCAVGPVIDTAALQGAAGAQDNPETVEWVVVMHAFDEDTLLDALAERRALSSDILRQLALASADFHMAAAPVEKDWRAVTNEVVRENLEELDAADCLDADAVAEMHALCDAQLARCDGLLRDRVAAGKVRRCHGDLHLHNICLIDGEPVLFDCIEFSDDFSEIDVLYDFAYLIMDLDRRAMHADATAMMNRYLEATRDYDGVALLPLYCAKRAQIRCKIAVATAALLVDSAVAEAKRQEARDYFDLAMGYLKPKPARLIAVGGASGSGKSTLARALAPDLDAMILRSDAIRKELYEWDEHSPLPQEAYAPDVSARVYQTMIDRCASLIGAGVSAIADATFTHPDSRAAIEQAATQAGAPFTGYWLEAPRDVLMRRVTDRSKDASDATAAVVARQLEQDWGAIAWRRVTMDDALSPEAPAKALLADLQ
ncbi:MAG: AAA family ATPase [Alphaproteobacteria bacterium]|nr:AAA family ATPase [Alphaproteobacteria bacterium]